MGAGKIGGGEIIRNNWYLRNVENHTLSLFIYSLSFKKGNFEKTNIYINQTPSLTVCIV